MNNLAAWRNMSWSKLTINSTKAQLLALFILPACCTLVNMDFQHL